ncbi:Uncharacterised protein [Vibrio cholerae]|nr:Uncharacterised protein [Vibrio cholerae]
MLGKAARYIGSDATIECVICTTHQINKPR